MSYAKIAAALAALSKAVGEMEKTHPAMARETKVVKPPKSKSKEVDEDDEDMDDEIEGGDDDEQEESDEEESEESDETDDDEESEEEISDEDMMLAFKKFTKGFGDVKKGRVECKKILKKFKVEKVKEIEQDDRAAVLKLLNAKK